VAPLAEASVDASAEQSAEPTQDAVPLVTGCSIHIPDCSFPSRGCYTSYATGLLVADATYGTAIIYLDVHAGRSGPVAWLPGFTARRAGAQVEVLDPDGHVVATTGHNYRLPGGYVSEPTWVKEYHWPEDTKGMFWTCDTPIARP
jgi:hypothetical protein